ncbi:flippase [Halanaerobium sp. MA284_MarDTE_T2]|jgi:O-antigen/teichoic acid export membrane protein|uniref:flippase n=1 Tax=Halanaerobium sp. MA284_MarDTE_T2 TaxID=2183913 RepID=UPI000DF19ECC|nr:flippase [Halanaerobium sp. MA284_MarDTE_T2]RCW44769.1 O-antigen/teichoic acid export membrane protein [Halanaerobium sp. MA284_MarDTE_T2]
MKKNKENSVSKNTFFNLLINIIKVLIPLLTIPYISRILGPEKLGTVNFIRSIINYFIIIAGLGIPIYASREIAKIKDDIQKRTKFFIEIEALRFITIVIVEFFFILLVLKFPNIVKGHIKLSLVFSGLIISSFFNIDWFYKGLGKFNFISNTLLFSKFIYLFLIFTTIKNRQDIYNYASIILLSDLIFNCLMFFVARYKLDYNKLSWEEINLKIHFKFVGWFLFSRLAVLVYTNLDSVMIGYIQNEESVGHYYVANRLVKIILPFVVATGAVLLPEISKLKEKNNYKKIRGYLRKSISIMIMISVPATLGLILLSDQIIPLIFGVKYKSVFTLRILSPLLIVIGFSSVYGTQILLPFNKEKEFSLIIIFGAIINFTLNLFLIKRIGYNGAAISTLIAEVIIAVLDYFLVKKIIRNIYDIKNIIQVVMSSFLMYIFILFFKHVFFNYMNNIFSISFIILTSSIIYFFVLYKLKNEVFLYGIDKFKNKFFS